MFTKRVEKIKRELQKYILKLINRKKKKLKNENNKFIHFLYKDSLNDLNNIKNSNSEYKLKCRQRKKRKSLVNKKRRVRDKYKEKEC